MSSEHHLRKLRGHTWLLGDVWMILDILYHLLQHLLSYSSRISPSVHDFCMSTKEAKRTFLTPGGILGDSWHIVSSPTALIRMNTGNQLSKSPEKSKAESSRGSHWILGRQTSWPSIFTKLYRPSRAPICIVKFGVTSPKNVDFRANSPHETLSDQPKCINVE